MFGISFLLNCISENIHAYTFLSLIWKLSISVSEVTLVDYRFLRSWSKWAFAVANVVCSSVFKLILLIPGHVIKSPLSIAFWNVDITGELAQACKYCASSNLYFFYVLYINSMFILFYCWG